ncbi:MFS transporter [Caballeronia sp. INDeC2]|uniref:MFS transporter n=1 Tax=Caballeronia sp. INDeC2 TaxID=2921747 RepID=UPI00202961B0|nr:MFS transporter [Caballeronia sp. INDeC2]
MMETSTPRAGWQRFVMLALITCVLALSTADRATLAVAGPGMSKELGLTAVQMGWLFGVFAWAYMIWQLPAGKLVDRFGTRMSVFLSIVLWSIVTFMMGGAAWLPQAFAGLLVLRFLLGTMESPGGPGAARVIATWFPSSERGFAGAVFNCAQYLSLGIFMPLMGYVAFHFGWKHVFGVMGILGLALAVVWWLLFYTPSERKRITPAEFDYIKNGGALVDEGANRRGGPEALSAEPAINVTQLLRTRMMMGVCLAQYCISAITFFFITWFPAYLVKARGFSIMEAGFASALPAICGCVGGVSAGIVSDWLLRRSGSLSVARKIPITVGLLLSAVIVGCNYTASNSLMVALMCLSFFGKGFGSLGWTVVADMAPARAVGLTGGLFNIFNAAAGIITPVAIGYIVQMTGSFELALAFVGCHAGLAIISYWLIVGPIRRIEIHSGKALPPAPIVSTRSTRPNKSI